MEEAASEYQYNRSSQDARARAAAGHKAPARIMPEMNSHMQEGKDPQNGGLMHEAEIDFHATSNAIMDALKAIDGRIDLSPEDKKKAIHILKGDGLKVGSAKKGAVHAPSEASMGDPNSYLYIMVPALLLIVIFSYYVMQKPKQRQSEKDR